MRRFGIGTKVILACLGVPLIAGMAVVGAEVGKEAVAAADCPEKLAAAEDLVRTDRNWTDQDIPGVGDYPEIHWQARAGGDPCSRMAPSDWVHQAVIRLTPGDVAALAERYDWEPVVLTGPESTVYPYGTPAETWPGLAPFVPDGTKWTYSEAWSEQHSQTGPGSRDLFLDPDRSLAFVLFSPI